MNLHKTYPTWEGVRLMNFTINFTKNPHSQPSRYSNAPQGLLPYSCCTSELHSRLCIHMHTHLASLRLTRCGCHCSSASRRKWGEFQGPVRGRRDHGFFHSVDSVLKSLVCQKSIIFFPASDVINTVSDVEWNAKNVQLPRGTTRG